MSLKTVPKPASPLDPCTSSNAVFVPIRRSQQIITLTIVIGPALGLAGLIALLWGRAVDLTDIAIAVVFYLVTGFGLTIGFHRLFTHNSFAPNRILKIVLAIAGSMALEGSLTSWVATHRRHHIYSDQPGDPHSPHRYGPQGIALLKGLMFAHIGWLFVSDASRAERYAPDILKDTDVQAIDKFFPLIAVGSLILPFWIGYLIDGTFYGALTTLVWAGLVRMALLHHVTWSVNSLCHTFGRRSVDTKDRSTNLWILSIVSLGDSWHNIHHAHPVWARHGAGKGMLDPSARLIRVFERFGWATKVRWPTNSAIEISARENSPTTSGFAKEPSSSY